MLQRWIIRAAILIASIAALIIGCLFFLHTATGKSMVRETVENYLQRKWKTEVWIGNIDYSLPNWIALEQVIILDRQKDTLLSGRRLYIGVKLLQLLANKVNVTDVRLEDMSLRCNRKVGGDAFNFQFILDAFAPSTDEKPTKPKGTPMQLLVSQLSLKNVRLIFSDQKQQFYFSAFINDFSCLPASLNPERKVYRFNDLVLGNSQVIVVDSSTKIKVPQNNIKSRGDPSVLLLLFSKMKLHNVFFSYRQPLNKSNYTIRVNNLQLHQALLDLSRRSVSARNIQLTNTAVDLATWIPARNPIKKVKKPSSVNAANSWNFRVDTVSLNNNSLVYQNAAQPATKGLDFQHINVQNINLQARRSGFDSSGFYAELGALSLFANNQLHVKRVAAGVRFSDSLLQVRDLVAAINQSQLTTHGDIVWPFKPSTHLNGSPQLLIESLSLYYGDLLLIQPRLRKQLPISLSSSEKIMVAGKFSGTLQSLKAKEISLSTSGRQLLLKGSIDLRMVGSDLDLTADVHQLKLRKQLLSKDLLKKLQNEKINLPEEIVLTGRVQVNVERMFTDLKLNSTFGQLQIKGSVNNIRSPEHLAYSFQMDANNFETGKWVGLDSILGKLTGQILIEGKGFQRNSLVAAARLQLQSVLINNYPVSNMDLQAGLHSSAFTIRSSILDPNLQAQMDLNGLLSPVFSVQGDVQIKRADLTQLGFTSDSLAYAGNINVNASYEQPYKINVRIRTDSNHLLIHGKQINADSFLLTCKTDQDSMMMAAKAPFIDAELLGNYSINVLPSEVTSIWRTLYPFNNPAPQGLVQRSDYNRLTTLYIKILPDSLLSTFLPNLELKHPLIIQGRHNASQKDSLLSVQLLAPGLRYNKFEGLDLQLTATAVDSIMRFSLSARELLNGTKRLAGTLITGHMQKSLLLVNGRVNDSVGKEYYSVQLEVKKENAEAAIRILDDLMLNHNKWKVPSDNLVRITKQGYFINHLSLENRGQTIYISTKDQQVLSPIDIRIDSFDISNVFTFLSLGDTLGARGTVNADISIQQPIHKVPIITGDIQATRLAVQGIPIGDLHFHSNSIGDSLELQGGLSGVNQLGFSGRIHVTNGGINLHARLDKLDNKILLTLAKDVLSHASGNVTGDLQLAGPLDTPKCTGAIYLDSMAFALKELNTPYRINSQKILIDYPDLLFEKFTLSDSLGHPMTIQGKITVFSPGKKKLDVNLETKDFMALNASRQTGASLYGIGILDAKVQVRGSIDVPIVEGSAYLHNKSSVHFVSSPKSYNTKTRKEGVVFVNIDTLAAQDSEVAKPLKDTAVTRSKFKGLQYNLDLRVDKDAEFSMIIDPSASDELVLKGEARLNAGVEENGSLGITGVYNLQSGYYKMNNLLLRGKFMLVKGSSISFNGDPTLAEADVTTEYVIEASPKGLLNYKESDNAAYTRVPFAVIFTIKGPVSKPVLSFDIQLKEGKTVLKSSEKSDIEHALDRLRSDVTEMNKQVFSLLLTKRFASTTSDNTLESSNLNANNALKEGVSSFLTEAMNQVADQLIKGVDVDVNMKTYKTADDPISKTDLGVAMSKDLFQDRLVIRIEENFAVGSNNTASTAKSGSQYVPDITSTYKLSKDGRFQVKGYQKNEYDAVVQGYFTEVGVNFTIELSYDKFMDLVRRRKSMSNEKK